MTPDDVPFLGTGWSFPPAFTPGGADVAMASGADDIRQSLLLLLATHPGERLLQETYGAGLDAVLFEEIDHALVNRLSGLVTDAILAHEPRIRLEAVDVSEDAATAGLLLIQITYTVRTTNTRYNMVYPFYLNEGAAPA